MSNEKVKYTYELIDDISSKLKKINKNLRENDTEFKKSGKGAKGFGSSLTAALPAIVGTTAALYATKKALDFTVGSVFKFSGASAKLKAIVKPTTEQFKALEKAALDYGATTAFTASQVMDAYTEQAKLGQTVNEILASGSAVLDLAAMSQIGLAEAATISTQTLNQFGLEADQTNKVVDVMAKSFTSSALDANKFAEAMKYAGTIGAESGNSIEDVTAALGALADRAIDSSQAGTATRRVMLQLADSNSKASKAIAATGKKADTFVEKLKVLKSLNLDLTDTTDMFGLLSSTAATVLIGAADDVAVLSDELQKADGSAKQMADTMLNSLPGALVKMKSALEGLALTTRDVLAPALTKVITEVTELAQAWKYLLSQKDVKKQEEMNNAVIDEMQGLKELRSEYEAIRDTQIAFQSHKSVLFSPDTMQDALNNIETVNEAIRDLNRNVQGVSGGPLPAASGGSTTTTTTSSSGGASAPSAAFKTPKVPVSYFEEMATKYQEQAEFKYTVDQQMMEREEEMQRKQKEWSIARTEMFIEENRKKQELQKAYKNTAIDSASVISNAIFTIGSQRTAHEKKQQIARIKNSKKSEAEKAKLIEAVEREAFEKNKKRAIFQALINGALGATKTIANVGFPAAIPLLVLQGVATAASIATIASQKFAKGGRVKQEPGKAATGDQHLIRADPGELVLTKEQQKNMGVTIGGTNIVIQGNVNQDTLTQIDQTLEDRNEALRQSLLDLSESGRIAGLVF